MTADITRGRVKQVAMTVRDLERAAAFYGDVLGLPLLVRTDQLAIFDCAGLRLMLSLPEGELQASAAVLYFDTPDVEGAFAALKGRGVAFIGAPHKVADFGDRQLWMAFFRDSEGNVMALEEERAAPSAA